MRIYTATKHGCIAYKADGCRCLHIRRINAGGSVRHHQQWVLVAYEQLRIHFSVKQHESFHFVYQRLGIPNRKVAPWTSGEPSDIGWVIHFDCPCLMDNRSAHINHEILAAWRLEFVVCTGKLALISSGSLSL